MRVIFNFPGIAIVGIGCVAALIAMQVEPPGLSGFAFLALGVTWFLADVAYRFKWGGRRFLHHLHGGHLYFIPMWARGQPPIRATRNHSSDLHAGAKRRQWASVP